MDLSEVAMVLFAPFGKTTVFVARCCGNLYIGETRPGACKNCKNTVTVTQVDLADPVQKQTAIDNLK